MKRYLAWALCALALASSAVDSHAGWVSHPVNWVRSNETIGTYFRSPWTTAAQAKVDTTEAFSIDEADFPPSLINKSSVSAQDTTIFCKLVFYGDSTTVSTVIFNTTTFAIQANSGSESSGWQTLYTYSSLNTSGEKYCEVPIWSTRTTAITRDAYIDRTGDLSLFGNVYRVIVTWNGATVAVPRAKCKLVFYRK